MRTQNHSINSNSKGEYISLDYITKESKKIFLNQIRELNLENNKPIFDNYNNFKSSLSYFNFKQQQTKSLTVNFFLLS